MPVAFGNTVNLGNGVLVSGRTDEGLDIILYEYLETTTGVGQPRILKVVTLAPEDVEAARAALLAPFGTVTDLGQGLVIEKLDSDDAADLVFYEDLFTTRGLGEPKEIRRVQITSLKVVEVTAALAVGPFAGHATLGDGLVSAWELQDETDSHGSNDLTNNNTVTFVSPNGTPPANMPATVANFVAASAQSLTRAAVAFPGANCSVVLWINGDSTQAENGNIVSLNNAWAAEVQFNLRTGHDTLGEKNVYALVGDGTTFVQSLNSSPTPIDNDWHLIIMTFTDSDQKIRVYVDNTEASASPSAALGSSRYSASALLSFGYAIPAGTGNYEGQMSSGLLYSRVITSGEQDDLWNDGDGLFF